MRVISWRDGKWSQISLTNCGPRLFLSSFLENQQQFMLTWDDFLSMLFPLGALAWSCPQRSLPSWPWLVSPGAMAHRVHTYVASAARSCGHHKTMRRSHRIKCPHRKGNILYNSACIKTGSDGSGVTGSIILSIMPLHVRVYREHLSKQSNILCQGIVHARYKKRKRSGPDLGCSTL